MKLTPLDIRHKEFKRGMRGYVDQEVDEFLDQIADEFERLFKENIDLGERIENLEEQVTRYRQLEETLKKTLVSAQQSAEELKQNATKESQLILRDAELKARQMVNESYADRQRLEGSLTKLRGIEEEFRIRFRQLLEGFLKQIDQTPPVAPPPKTDLNRQAEAIKEAIAREETVVAPPPAGPAEPAQAARPRPAETPPARPAKPAETPPAEAPAARPSGPIPDPALGRAPRFGPGSAGDLEAMTSVTAAGVAATQPGAPTAAEVVGRAPRPDGASAAGSEEATASGPSEDDRRSGDGDLLVDVDTGVSDDEFKW